ncbi:hypothetical protein [Micromonospora pattaloongensis]|uniref:hypothetical protein n=1 Tax=Micromonospora pattaloongensis TaxID=405436 RepID=UPI001FDEA8CB|nr:hypothetical protein [Micromonospora pattaloongensis]
MTEPPPDPEPHPRRWLPDLAAVASFVLLSFWVTARLWRHPRHGVADNPMDQAFFEWMLAHGARVVTAFTYPFVSTQMNVPDGVNMMANTSVLGISIPMSPITLAFGPHVAFNVFLTGALIATATSWYFVLSRFIVRSRAAAWIGALFCGFAPSMVSHSNAHPNIVAQFLVPVIIWRTLRLREPGRWLRNGLLLALAIVWQAFINLEILLLTAVGLGLFVGMLALLRRDLRRDARTFAAGLAVAAVVAGALLAYPIYVQFFGPQAYHGLPPDIRRYGADAASFVAFARESLAGSPATAAGLAQNPTEENAFFGWPLIILVGAIVLWLRRTPTVLALAVVGAVFAALSLGPYVRFAGHRTDIPSVWRLMTNVPVLNSVVPTRWALAIAPVVGLLLAIAWEHSRTLAQRNPNVSGQIRFATGAGLAMALVPIAPTPLPSVKLPETPQFIAAGTWREYVGAGQSVATLPLPSLAYSDPLRWSAQTRLEMPIPRGYFLGPRNDPKRPKDRTAIFTAPARPTASLFASIQRTGRLPTITPRLRDQAREDLRYWRSPVVILAPQKREALHLRAMTELVGVAPRWIGGVWVWDVRPLLR